jgi:hypothetical protein
MKRTRNSIAAEASSAMRLAERERRVAALRDGVKVRAITIPDRRKQANKRACRGRGLAD